MATSAPNGSAVTLDELIALNDEIAALARAGVPMELGLGHAGRDMPGRLGALMTRLSERTSQGESLADVLADPAQGVPSVYAAVVSAGIRSGRLPAALETVARSTRRLAETRRMVISATLYPLLVLMVAWGVVVLFVVRLAPLMLPVMEGFNAAIQVPFGLLVRCGDSAVYWGPALPLLMLAAVAHWLYHSNRTSLAMPRSGGLMLAWIPWFGPMIRSLRTAAFCDTLCSLLGQRVPVSEAIVLAAQAVGQRRLCEGAETIAKAINEGQSVDAGVMRRAGLPPLVGWILGNAKQGDAIIAALRHASEVYHRRTIRLATMIRSLLPAGLTILTGAVVAAIYVGVVFGPWLSVAYKLMEPR